MNKKIYLLPLLLLALVFASCEETKEVSIYDNWQERNEVFIDSLYNEYTTKADRGGLDTIHLLSYPDNYIFYKVKTPVMNQTEETVGYDYIEGYVSEDIQPFSTDSVYVYSKGTLIIGNQFEGTFSGANPTIFDSPSKLYVNASSTLIGRSEILQRMKVGERWEVYIPWQFGYGSSGSGSILGYTTLIFDMQLYSVLNRSSNALPLMVEE